MLKLHIAKTKKSVLLLGPRQVGKSTLINGLEPDLSVNLANEMTFLKHTSSPGELRALVEVNEAKSISIDEVQRIPSILNTVQSLIDEDKTRKFYLTGSSARKLRRGGANLLPGRVLNFKLGGLAAAEMDYKMDTSRALSLGTLPEPHLSEQSAEAELLLRSYSANYLQEEIKAEALTRNLDAFSRFLQVSLLSVGQFVDYTKLARAAKVSRHSVPRYFEIIEDTLIGNRIYPFSELAESESLIRHPKFYLFDNGVYNGAIGNFTPSLDRVGVLAEQLVLNQFMNSCWSLGKEPNVSSFRKRSGLEVDFVFKVDNEHFAVEVKNGDDTETDDFEGLQHFCKVFPKTKGAYLFHMGSREQKFGKIWSVPWQKGLQIMGL